MARDFVHLHLHTEFSLLDGYTRIKKLFARAKELGMKSVAITDHGSMFGVVDFYKEAKKHDIRPVIGCEVYTSTRSRFQKDNTSDKRVGHLVLLAKNQQGYQNLIKIVSRGYTEGFYYKPRVDYDLLEEYSEGLICLSACLAGEINQLLYNDRYDEAKDLALRLNNIYGHGNFYLEVQDHGIEEQVKVNRGVVKLSKDTGIPMVATNDVHYLNKEDNVVHDILLCIQTGKTVDDTSRMRFSGEEFYMKSGDEMFELFKDIPEAISNSVKIAEMCNVDFDFDQMHLPGYDAPDGKDNKDYLRELCFKGLEDRYDEITTEIKERMEYELDTIEQMGYSDYFLIVWDFIKYAKDNKIVVGPGRGSCGGSIVAYALYITDIDPIEYSLIFERFLNPERITMPDIDIDFEDERRQEVIDYVVEKYGKDKVAQIITFGTMAARGAIRDVGRAINMPYADVDKIAKEIPTQLGITIEGALKLNPALKRIYDEDNESRYLLDVAMQLEGVPRHASTHAAGVVISAKAIEEYVPLYLHDNSVTTQFNMNLLEELGLLKMDFLGLRNLSVIKEAIRLIKINRGIDIDFNKIDFNDPDTYKLLSSGETLGVFQLESNGMRSFMKDLKPENIEDIIAGISLFRPGPMDSIPKYIKYKNNPDIIKYLHPKLEPIMNVTYGCLVYQEQVMQVVRQLGGYSYGRSDLVRRAMGKKKMDVMEKERDIFINGLLDEEGNVEIAGCVRNGVDAKTANIIFDDMIDFAKYAFNKSHAASYAVLAYQTAYLKHHYTVEFMAALMTSVMGNSSKVAEYIGDCKRLGINILAPDVNESYSKFTVVDGNIRFGLMAVKNVGSGIIRAIIEGRKTKKFKTFMDFCEGIDTKELNKRAVDSLIKAGAFDSFDISRATLIGNYERIIEGIQQDRRRNVAGQVSLFSDFAEEVTGFSQNEQLVEVKEFSKKILLNFEKEMLGIYVSGHPLAEYNDLIEKYPFDTSLQIKEVDDEGHHIMRDRQKVVLPGIIMKKSDKATRNNNIMTFLTLEDMFGSIEIIVFPNVYERSIDKLYEDNAVIIVGRINVKEDEDPKIICESIHPLSEDGLGKLSKRPRSKLDRPKVANNNGQKLYIKLDTRDEKLEEKIKHYLGKYNGDTPVMLYDASKKKTLRADKALWVRPCKELMVELTGLLGDGYVILK